MTPGDRALDRSAAAAPTWSYRAPVSAIAFALESQAGFRSVAEQAGCAPAVADELVQRLDALEAFCRTQIQPLNPARSDRATRRVDGRVQLHPDSVRVHRALLATGWHAWTTPRQFGGQGMPLAQRAAVDEILNGHNAGFSLLTLLTQGALLALQAAPSTAFRDRCIDELVAGRWSATMCFTETEAGSDLSRLTTTAEPLADGRFLLRGRKSMIGFGDHPVCDNIVHLVAARLVAMDPVAAGPGPSDPVAAVPASVGPGIAAATAQAPAAPAQAPAEAAPIALFLVPRLIEAEAGAPATSNQVICTGLEPALGMRDSPTVGLDFDGAIGYRLGEPADGLRLMTGVLAVTRIVVALQAIGIGEAATQAAVARARQRRQGRDSRGKLVAIIDHPDVRRLLLTMRALVDAGRALAYRAVGLYDRNRLEPTRTGAATYDYLLPVIKGWCTESGIEVASHGVQVHGGRGVLDAEPQRYLCDARALAIYEGTTAIQARDLVRRKVLADRGKTARVWLAEVRACAEALARVPVADGVEPGVEAGVETGRLACRRLARRLQSACASLQQSLDHLLALPQPDARRTLAVSVPFLMLNGYVAGGWALGRGLLVLQPPQTPQRPQTQQPPQTHQSPQKSQPPQTPAAGASPPCDERTRQQCFLSAAFYADHLLVRCDSLAREVIEGGEILTTLDTDLL